MTKNESIEPVQKPEISISSNSSPPESNKISSIKDAAKPSTTSVTSSKLQKKPPMKKRLSSSGIPLATKGTAVSKPSKPSLLKPPATITKTYGNKTSNIATSSAAVMDKHTIEIQFNNHKKRLAQMQEELLAKQLPIKELHKNLVSKKKTLEKLGKIVALDQLKFMTCSSNADDAPPPSSTKVDLNMLQNGGGENLDNELMINLNFSMDGLLNSVSKMYSNDHV